MEQSNETAKNAKVAKNQGIGHQRCTHAAAQQELQ
jgi:hypothetical protein